MIPKIIHYCWLSNDPIPEKLQEYMTSWKKYLPDYEFMKWDFHRFPKESCTWVSEAFDHKRYAFAADYIRIYALYHFGGIYVDMDVEVLKSFDDLLHLPYFLCYEDGNNSPEVAAFGAEKGNDFIGDLLNYYEGRHFVNRNGEVIKDSVIPLPIIFKRFLLNKGYFFIDVNNADDILKYYNQQTICLLPSDFFSPRSHKDGKIYCTKNSYCIHYFSGSWLPWYKRTDFVTKHQIISRIIWHLEHPLYEVRKMVKRIFLISK